MTKTSFKRSAMRLDNWSEYMSGIGSKERELMRLIRSASVAAGNGSDSAASSYRMHPSDQTSDL
jgi:hypothetical protein